MRGDSLSRLGIAAVLMLAACETQHSFFVENRIADPIGVHVEADWELEISDCESAKLGKASTTDQTVNANATLCFSGPVVGGSDEYDILDHVTALRVTHNAATCVEGTGAALRDRFTKEQDNYVLTVDATVCP